MSDSETPIAYVTPTLGNNGVVLLIVKKCPLCGKQHCHGGGRDIKNPLLGHRVSHCAEERDDDTGYILKLREKKR